MIFKSKDKCFKTVDICEIVKVCSENGVSSVKLGDLEIKFALVHRPAIGEVFVPEEVQERSDSQARDARATEEINLKRRQFEQMMIEDPAQYEELVRTGELDERA